MTSDSERKAAEEWVSLPEIDSILETDEELSLHSAAIMGFLAGRSSALKEQEQIAREAFEAGQDSLVMIEKVPFRDYWQQKTESKQ